MGAERSGACPPEVVEAIVQAAHRGTSYGAPTEAESKLAELIGAAMPSIQKLRLVSSGTEATMSAIRLARGATGRERIIKFAGNYHGHVDSLLVAAGSSALNLGVPDSLGVTRGTSQDTMVLPYNDRSAAEAAFAAHGDSIAAVIMEPIVGNMGCVPPVEGYLAAIRKLCDQYGSLLIFDEVMTGFRVAHGGAQALYQVTPDLTTLGKIVGGGLPVGAYGGKAELMDQVLPAGKVFQAGTLSGNPLATAAGIRTLELLRDEDPVSSARTAVEPTGRRPGGGGDGGGFAASALARRQHDDPVFCDGPVRCWEDANRADRGRFARFFWGMVHRGVYLPCSQFEALFVSVEHEERLIDETLAAARNVLAELAE